MTAVPRQNAWARAAGPGAGPPDFAVVRPFSLGGVMELLERAEALEQAQASLTRARAGRGGVLLLSGEAGIGKTSVVADRKSVV